MTATRLPHIEWMIVYLCCLIVGRLTMRPAVSWQALDFVGVLCHRIIIIIIIIIPNITIQITWNSNR